MKEQGVLLNIDVCHKVIRSDTVLDLLTQLKSTCEKKGQDWKEEIKTSLVGTTVVTRYFHSFLI